MSDPAVPTPPSAGRLSAAERGVRRHRIMERAPRGWSCDRLVRRAADDNARAFAARGAGRRRAAAPRAVSICQQPSDFPRSAQK
jgi:hypothetical protein